MREKEENTEERFSLQSRYALQRFPREIYENIKNIDWCV